MSLAIPTQSDTDPKMMYSKPSPLPSFKKQPYAVGGLILALFGLVLFVSRAFMSSDADFFTPSLREKFPEVFRIGVIADLDKRSKRKDAKGKESWHSTYMTGTLKRTGDLKNQKYSLQWDEPTDVSTSHNEAGRGCELSELVRYNGALYTFDDRTGLMFELKDGENSANKKAAIIPRHIFMEGDGMTDKGQKIEWASVKDGLLYVGSFGKEFTDNDGNIIHSNNLWTAVVNKNGEAEHVDWSPHYNAMRATFGYQHPGYLLHEAIVWSTVHKKWFVFPRRMSFEAYDDVSDEKRGANTLITANADFSEFHKYTLGKLTPERGFSSAKFLPGSHDSVIIALKSAENAELDEQTSYITMYGYDAETDAWNVLMDEVELPGKSKFEGVEVISWY